MGITISSERSATASPSFSILLGFWNLPTRLRSIISNTEDARNGVSPLPVMFVHPVSINFLSVDCALIQINDTKISSSVNFAATSLSIVEKSSVSNGDDASFSSDEGKKTLAAIKLLLLSRVEFDDVIATANNIRDGRARYSAIDENNGIGREYMPSMRWRRLLLPMAEFEINCNWCDG